MATGTKATRKTLSGDDLRQMLDAGRASLEMNVELVNSLNVFPVPDGDTGTNMLLTLKSADDELRDLAAADASQVAEAVARGTLMGARGNSGVILSQYFKGWAQGLKGCRTFGGAEIAGALADASEAAYKAVSKPVEGTILTVIRAAADGAREAVNAKGTAPKEVWGRACQSARIALEATPDLLPVLKEAGVVDSGGLGLVALLEGTLAYFHGEPVKPLEVETGQLAPGAAYLSATEEEAYGYCTQFLLQGAGLDLEGVRERMTAMADSTVVVGDASTLNVHVHTYDPGSILSYGVSLGSLTQIKIDNIDQQHQEFLELHRQPRQEVPVGVVAVVSGAGLQRLFRNLGCIGLVHGGQTMNPSTRDLAEAVQEAGAASVVLLPNNSNIVSAAQQAMTVSSKPLHVVPTTSIPHGIAALLAFNPDMDVQTNLAQMQEAVAGVRSGEVTTAVRSTSVNGVATREGQAIAMLDGELLAAADTVAEAAREIFRRAAPAPGSLATLYWGGDAREKDAGELAAWIAANFTEVEAEVVHGGQPLYHYLVSLE